MTRVIWWLALAAVAIIVVVAELDRGAYTRPELAVAVPRPFRGFAQPTMTMVAFAAGTPQAAQAEARALVRRRPVPAENLYLLALAELRAGNTQGYAQAFELATTRGWRAVPLQIAAAEAAIGRGDAEAGALRIAAVWAVDGANVAMTGLVAELLALPRGPEAMGAAIAATRVNPANFAAVVKGISTSDRAERALSAAKRAGMAIDAR